MKGLHIFWKRSAHEYSPKTWSLMWTGGGRGGTCIFSHTVKHSVDLFHVNILLFLRDGEEPFLFKSQASKNEKLHFFCTKSSFLDCCWSHHPSALLHLIISEALLLISVSDPGLLAARIRLDYVTFCLFIVFLFFSSLATVCALHNHDKSCYLHEENSHLGSSLLCWAYCASEQRAAGQKSVLQIQGGLTYADTPPAVQHLDTVNQKPMYMLACIFYYSHLISLGNYSLHHHLLSFVSMPKHRACVEDWILQWRQKLSRSCRILFDPTESLARVLFKVT